MSDKTDMAENGGRQQPGMTSALAWSDSLWGGRFFNRFGGVSTKPYASFNLSYHVGDDESAVAENRRRVKSWFDADHLVSCRQVHGDRVQAVASADCDYEIDGCDALITDVPGIALLIQQADCQAVLLHDPVRRVIGAVHCGWRGSVANIIGATVACLQSRYQVSPADLEAYIGPSLGPCCAEFVHYAKELPSSFHRFQVRPTYFDFWHVSTRQLADAGVRQDNICVSGICTSCSSDYFSYRRARRLRDGVTGRHGSAICLRPGGRDGA